MNVAQEIVARLYVAGPEVSDPPEVIGPVDGVANPAGKSDGGSSTDSSCVPVSWPDAAGSGVIDAVGQRGRPAPSVARRGAGAVAEAPRSADGRRACGGRSRGRRRTTRTARGRAPRDREQHPGDDRERADGAAIAANSN